MKNVSSNKLNVVNSKGEFEMEKFVKEESQYPRGIWELAHRLATLENQVLLLLANQNIDTDESIRQLDALEALYADKFSQDGWEGFVTSLTHDIEQRCAAVEAHLGRRRPEGSN